MKQLSIFDWMPEETPDINDISEAEAVRIVGERLGVDFVKNWFGYYEAKKGKLKIELQYSHFVPGVNNGRLFLDASFSYGSGCGGGSPCDGIEDAIKYLTGKMKWTEEQERAKR